jgi:hypothetical protein
MQLTPVIIRKHKLNQSHGLFMKKLRSKTREPYFDNRNSRRLDIDDPKGTIYADEYDNIISLRNEVMNKHWMVYKTIIFFSKKNGGKYFWSISYPGHYATVITIASIFLIFAGFYYLLVSNNYKILFGSIGLYALIVYMSIDEYKSHLDLIMACNVLNAKTWTHFSN